MSLKETGRTGAKVELTGDGTLGLVTQNPDSVLHSSGGLERADGNTGYGQPFSLATRFAQTADGTTTANLCDSDVPFKFRVLSGQVQCVDEANRRTEKGCGRSSLVISQGASDVLAVLPCTGMQVGEVRKVRLNTLGNEIVPTDGSLRVALKTVLPAQAKSSTWELVVTLDCIRVV